LSWSEQTHNGCHELAGLRHCRSRKELILAARRLGYRITRIDLLRAWQEEQRQAVSP